LEEGESFADAALRELFEETGIRMDCVGPFIAQRDFELQLADGECVLAEERFFAVRVSGQGVSREYWTSEEIEVMTDHRWWTMEELRTTNELVFPESLVDILANTET
jgi:8-oxo-dGTP pyrophosphatase MutT (NUDIX family)